MSSCFVFVDWDDYQDPFHEGKDFSNPLKEKYPGKPFKGFTTVNGKAHYDIHENFTGFSDGGFGYRDGSSSGSLKGKGQDLPPQMDSLPEKSES